MKNTSKPSTQPELFNDHNEIVINSVELEIAATAKWFATLSPKEQSALLAKIGARRIAEATS